MAENECKRLNTDGMRKLAKSVKEGQGTRVGSIAKMLIDCCDRIDRLEDENKSLKKQARCPCGGELEGMGYHQGEKVVVFRCVEASKVTNHFLKVEDKDNG